MHEFTLEFEFDHFVPCNGADGVEALGRSVHHLQAVAHVLLYEHPIVVVELVVRQRDGTVRSRLMLYGSCVIHIILLILSDRFKRLVCVEPVADDE